MQERESDEAPKGVQLPDAAPMVGPERRRRRHRSIDRVRIGLSLGALLVIGTAFFALPIAEDVRTSTLDFLSITNNDQASPREIPEVADFPEERVVPEVVFDSSVFVDPRMVGMSPPNVTEGLLTFRGSPTRSFYGRGPIPPRGPQEATRARAARPPRLPDPGDGDESLTIGQTTGPTTIEAARSRARSGPTRSSTSARANSMAVPGPWLVRRLPERTTRAPACSRTPTRRS